MSAYVEIYAKINNDVTMEIFGRCASMENDLSNHFRYTTEPIEITYDKLLIIVDILNDQYQRDYDKMKKIRQDYLESLSKLNITKENFESYTSELYSSSFENYDNELMKAETDKIISDLRYVLQIMKDNSDKPIKYYFINN